MGLECQKEQADPFIHSPGKTPSPLAFSRNGKKHKLDGKSNYKKKLNKDLPLDLDGTEA